jgi:hypothetical protein
VFLVSFIICWVIGRIIKGLEPLGWERPFKKGGREIWWSGFYGDLFLPIGVTAGVITIRYLNNVPHWYTSVWWNWLGVVLGFMIIITLELTSKNTIKQLVTPSKLWHTFIAFPCMFYLVFVTTIPLFIIHKPISVVVIAVICYGVWDFTYLHDLLRPPDFSKTH